MGDPFHHVLNCAENKVSSLIIALNYPLISDQLRAIRKITLSRVICSSCDRVNAIQKFALLQPISQVFKNLGCVPFAFSE